MSACSSRLRLTFLVSCFMLWTGWQPSVAQTGGSARSDALRERAEKRFGDGDYAGALNDYESAYRTALPKDRARAANLCVDISTVFHVRGDFVTGKEVCRRGLRLIQDEAGIPDSVRYKLAASLGEMYHGLFVHDSAHYYFRESLSLYQRHPELARQIPDYVAFGLNNHAMLYLLENNDAQAEVMLENAIGVYRRQNNREQMAVLISSLAGYLHQTGRYEQAIAKRQEALSLMGGSHPQRISVMLGLAWDYFAVGRIRDAGQTLREAQKLPAGNPASAARVYYGLARCEMADLRPDRAEKLLSDGMALLRKNNISRGELMGLFHLEMARADEKRGNSRKALRWLQQGLAATHTSFRGETDAENPEFEGSLSESTAFQLLWYKARLLEGMARTENSSERLKTSLATYMALIRFRNKMLTRLDRLETRTLVTDRQNDLFGETLDICHRLWLQTRNPWYQAVFFSALENSRASALVIGLLDRRIKPQTLPDSLLDQERKLQRSITREKSRMLSGTGASDQLKKKEFELVRFQDTYRRLYPAYYQAHYAQERLTLDSLRRLLQPDQTYLDYFIGKEAVFAACVSRNGVSIHRLAIPASVLRKEVSDWGRQVYEDPGFGAYEGTETGIRLYRHLLAPFGKLLQPKLLIARSGELNKLPFDVLQAGPDASSFVGRTHRVSYVHAATVHFSPVGKEKRQTSWLTFAPFSEKIPESPWRPLRTPEPLPGGEKVKAGREATKEAFLHLAGGQGVLHLATHAVASADTAHPSFVAFYPEKDYRLSAQEIMQTDLSGSRLTILGACQGGEGVLSPAEGVQSLAYSFAYAGCPSVASTVWVANDETTAFLTGRFARYCREGLDLDEALFRARADYAGSELGRKYDHPFYWANLVLWGPVDPLPASSGFAAWWLAGLIPVLAGGLAWRKRKYGHFFR